MIFMIKRRTNLICRIWKSGFQGGFVFTKIQHLGIFYHLEVRLKFFAIKINKVSQNAFFSFMLLPDLWNKSALVIPHISKIAPISKCACNCVSETLVQAFPQKLQKRFPKIASCVLF